MENISEHSWNSEPEVGKLLASLFEIEPGFMNFLEVGTFKGATYTSFLANMPKFFNYTGIDIEDFREESVKEKMESFTNHKMMFGDSLKMLKQMPINEYQLIFIDTIHEFDHCMAEFKICEGLISKGGLIAFHDSVKFPGVAQVINYIKNFPHFDVLTLNTPLANGLTLVKCNYP